MDISLTHKKILEAINQAENILIVVHIAPDLDAVGSGCAFIEYLSLKGKNYQVYCQDKLDLNLRFLAKTDQFQNQKPDLNNFDLVLALDCADSLRTGLADQILKRAEKTKIINIDHHACNDYFGDINLIRPDYSSTSEIIYDFFEEMKINKTRNMAHSLLAGLVFDTGNFSNPATTFNSLRVASSLMLLGANLAQILEQIYRNKNLPTLRLWGKVLSGLHYNEEYEVAISVISQDDIKKYGLAEELVEGMTNFLNNVVSVRIILVLREAEDGTVKGSLRTSHDDADVKKIAEVFGGGGHVKAAGFKINGQLQKEKERWVVV